MDKVEDYIYSFEGDEQEVLLYFHELLISFPAVTSKLRFKIPFYYQNTWVCYLNPVKPNKIAICFLRGYEMSNEQGLLVSKGRKQVLSAEFASVDEIPKKLMNEIINEALFLDETVPYKPKSR
ncbi:MAG TPA: DUF1801 domain-containing protein [Balneola sp.]|jgi:hypothetical protein|nr:hypothetical protein [Bacteroidota bacterium]MAC05459.1 hypothetical protein [Balneola sp.]MAO77590.1 hypothetical protein [Balneola sp.]MBF63804.1 hypothetical protein [Balneola sp.]HAH50585.1 DUF1801 domain-containing protein [Balneola sp.]|tara:strand:- start:9000 stop:9368 length:369 start_codon:yes stop_codon:yes gene_type:complete